MKINNKIKTICTFALIAQGATAAVDNYVEIGLDVANQKSFKFGEYNGLYESGVNGSLGIFGGDALKSPTETRLWSFTGTDVGTTSRNLTGTLSDQGKWKLKVGYDELRHSISDSYQTPLQGNMGGNNFSLPTNFGAINTTAPGTRGSALTSDQKAMFATTDVYTSRKNTSLNSTYVFNPNLNLQFDYNHLDQSGAKLMGAGTLGAIVVGASTSRGQGVNIIMSPTKYKTDSFTLGLNWYTDKSYLTAGYYGSIFKDAYSSVTYQDSLMSGAVGVGCSGVACYSVQNISTAPDNTFHQLNLNGGYDFTTSTKLTAGLSYGRNTQDQTYVDTVIAQNSSAGTSDNMKAGTTLPATSLNGLVINTHADVKVTNQTTSDLTLSAGMKYNKRLDKTASKTYYYKDISGGASGQTGINAPYSNSKLETELAADYRLTRDQKLRLSYERENIYRWCDGIASGAECIASPKSRENKLNALYKIKATDTLRFNTGYTYSNKQGEFNHNYVGNVAGAANTSPASNTTTNGGNRLGFESRLFASRQENIIRAGANWQPIEDVDMGLSGRYIQDKYEALLGVQANRGKSASFDSTYSINQNHNVSLYTNWQTGYRDLLDATNGTTTTAATQLWANRIKEDVTSFGIGSQHTGLMDGKMEVTTDLSYSMDKTKWNTQVFYLTEANCGIGSTASTAGSCGQVEMKNKLTTFKVTDSYLLSKNGKISLGYIYEHNNNSDFFYNIYQTGYTPRDLMPTNEQAPNYTVHLVTASYTYLF